MSDLFRKEAVENYTTNREATLSVRAIPVRWVLYIIILILCVTLFCVWLFGGTVYESETVRGIAWPNKSYGDVYAEKSGIVTKTTVSVGDTVKAGDILAFMPDEDMLDVPEEEKNYEAYDRASAIRAKTNGIVTYVIDRNSYVNEGDLIAAVISYDKNGNNDILTAFVPVEKSSLIGLGMEVQIMPDYAPRDKYGYISGFVSAISEYPVTGEQIYNSNKQLYMSGMDFSESYIEIEVTMMRSAGEGSHLKWSTKTGRDITVKPGTRCDMDIILDKYRPFDWLFRRA